MKTERLIIIITFSLFFQIFLQITSASIILGSNVNITDGTTIVLPGMNTTITVKNNHTVSGLEVYSNFLLMNASLTAPTHILNLPYNYSPTTKMINITGRSNTTVNLTVNVTTLGDGIKIYHVSTPSYLISVSWSDSTKLFSFKVNSSSGTNSTVKVYWPYSFSPRGISCSNCKAYSSSFNSTNNITTLIANHSSLVTWSLYVKLPDGYSCSANDQCLNGYCVHGTCRSSSIYCGDGYCDSGETCSSCSQDCGLCPFLSPKVYSLAFYDLTDLIEIDQGLSKITCFTLSNNGTAQIQNISITLSGIETDWFGIDPNFLSKLEISKNTTTCINFAIPETAEATDYLLEVGARDETSIKTNLTLRVLERIVVPKINETAKLEAEQSIAKARNKINQAEALGIDVSEAKDLLNQGVNQYNQGNYELSRQFAEQSYLKAEELLKVEKEKPTIPIEWIIGIVSVVIAIIGVSIWRLDLLKKRCPLCGGRMKTEYKGSC